MLSRLAKRGVLTQSILVEDKKLQSWPAYQRTAQKCSLMRVTATGAYPCCFSG
jgi:hypothetical protein